MPWRHWFLVSPGAITDGVVFFTEKKLTTFYFLVIAVCKVIKSGDLF